MADQLRSQDSSVPEKFGDTGDEENGVKVRRNPFKVKFSEHISRQFSKFEASFRPKRIRLHSPPHQRQRWGEAQCLPRVNWGDLFFDLFFVSATYQVSLIIGEDPSLNGILYAAGTFLPVMGIWWERLWYDARYVHDDDLVHRVGELLILVILATAVLHIRSVSIMSDPSQPSMFAFCIAMLLDRVYAFCRYAEVFFLGVGDEGLKGSVTRLALPRGLGFAGYLAATIVSGLAYYGQDGAVERRLAQADATNESVASSNIPIWLCFAGFVASQIGYTIELQFFIPTGTHKKKSVPMNVDFTIHRNGEWTMLMLGESVFSLLIVQVPFDVENFYTIFFCGMLTVILLQYLHFRSQPHHADDHALRRNKDAGIWWNTMNLVYSFFLVCLGADYTVFLSETYDDANSRRLEGARSLAGDESQHDPETLRVMCANLYSASLAIIFFCLDVMTLLHLGIKESKNRCICRQHKRKNLKGISLIILRLGMLGFTATMGLWTTDPANLAVLGVVCVAVQLMLRKLGGQFLSHAQVHALNPDIPEDEDSDADASWPNVTHARAIRAPPPGAEGE